MRSLLPLLALAWSPTKVINGILLPYLATCLLLCMNDPAIMPVPPTRFENGMLLFSVCVTILLASNVIIERGGGLFTDADIREGSNAASGAIALVGTAGLAASISRRRK